MKDYDLFVKELSEGFRTDVIDFTQRLVKTPALPGEEKDIADLYLAEMEKLGYDEVFRDRWGNVIGIVNGNEPGPTIMYNAHLDHVDTGDYSEWGGYDPYGAEIDFDDMENQDGDGFENTEVIHGRGASDVKAGGACQVYSGRILLELREQGYPVKGKFIFTGAVLEEPAEQMGMKKLLDETFPERGLDFDSVVSCEATSLKLYLGHRGRVEVKIVVSGVTSHGSAPWLGINAVNKATKLIDRIEQYMEKSHKVDPDLGRSSIALTNINCTPGGLSIVPDRCIIRYDRRLVPGETAEDSIKEIQEIIDELTNEDSDFRATVEVDKVPRTTYTGLTETLPNIKEAWKIDKDHPFVKAAGQGLSNIGQPIKYGYWSFGTDLAVICGRDKKAAIGYSGMQETYCHRPIDKVRIDYMMKSLEGNVAIFKELTELNKEDFNIDL